MIKLNIKLKLIPYASFSKRENKKPLQISFDHCDPFFKSYLKEDQICVGIWFIVIRVCSFASSSRKDFGDCEFKELAFVSDSDCLQSR